MLFLIHTIHSIACLQRIIVYSNQTGLAGKSTIYRWFSHWNLHFWGFPSQPRLMTPEAILLWYPQAWPLDPIPFVLRCEKIIKILLFSLKNNVWLPEGMRTMPAFQSIVITQLHDQLLGYLNIYQWSRAYSSCNITWASQPANFWPHNTGFLVSSNSTCFVGVSQESHIKPHIFGGETLKRIAFSGTM